ncbi:MAG: SDR family oxidoreductase [Reyranella sp.]|nr:SDR family oxidoreductase [Reyranella sp.]
MTRLTGKIAIVTGAASGIGAASAKLFADEGAQVLAVDRPESAIDQAHARNNAIAAFGCDITGDDAPKRIVAEALAKFGAVDILFNNAGVSGRAFVEEMTDAQWDHVNGVNVRAMFRMCREAIPALSAHRQHRLGDGFRHRLWAGCLLRLQGGCRRADAHAGARARQVQHHRQLCLSRRYLHRHDAHQLRQSGNPRGLGKESGLAPARPADRYCPWRAPPGVR